MSIEKTWSEMNGGDDKDLSSLLNTKSIANLSSNNPMQKIKKNLLKNICCAAVICLAYIFIIFYFYIWQVQLCIAIVLLFSLWALYTAYVQYRQMDTKVDAGLALLAEMKRQYDAMIAWMKTQQKVALFIYPVSAAGGFMLGGVLGSGKPVALFMHKPVAWIALLVSIAVLVPACYYLARWMFHYSFGKHLALLKANIEALEEKNNFL